MRYALTTLVLALGLFALVARGEDATAQDKAFFEKQIGKLVKLEPQPLTGAALDKVFSAKFFKVNVSIGASGGGQDLVVARSGDNAVEVTTPGTTEDMPDLKKLVKADFKLKADADGKTFESALDLLYPIDERFDKEDLKVKAVKHKGTEWTFIRGKFFDNFKGIVVTTNADGVITNIKYSLEIK
jgi:hypothetical protein